MSKDHSVTVRYNRMLYQYPLLTKSATGATLSALGEIVSQWATIITTRRKVDKENTEGDSAKGMKTTIGSSLKCLICDSNFSKVFIMFCFGGLINAPINHFMYKWITKYTEKRFISLRVKQLVQLLASLSIVSPIQVFFLVSILTIVNSDVKGRLTKYFPFIKQNLKTKYFKILTSSWISSSLLVSFAQRFIEPEKWSVFFSFAYAILGTGQNIYLKMMAAASAGKA